MATQPQPRAIGSSTAGPDSGVTPAKSSESALVQSPMQLAEVAGENRPESAVFRIPIEVDVAVPIRKFRVRHLLALARDQVIETRWIDGDDLPLATRGAQLAWTEFEVIDQKLAVRITRLA